MKELDTTYTAPDCRVVEIKTQKVLCDSAGAPDYNKRDDIDITWI